jgi:hypothetical protein
VWPALHRALHLLRTDRSTAAEQKQRHQMRAEGRYTGIEVTWLNFVRWCRTYSTEPLTLGEKINRSVWCPNGGHKFGEIQEGVDEFHATCRACHYTATAPTAAALRQIEVDGTSRRNPMTTRRRKREM